MPAWSGSSGAIGAAAGGPRASVPAAWSTGGVRARIPAAAAPSGLAARPGTGPAEPARVGVYGGPSLGWLCGLRSFWFGRRPFSAIGVVITCGYSCRQDMIPGVGWMVGRVFWSASADFLGGFGMSCVINDCYWPAVRIFCENPRIDPGTFTRLLLMRSRDKTVDGDSYPVLVWYLGVPMGISEFMAIVKRDVFGDWSDPGGPSRPPAKATTARAGSRGPARGCGPRP